MYTVPYQQYTQQNFENQPLNIQVAMALRKAITLVGEAKRAMLDEKYDLRFEKIEHATKIIMLLNESFVESAVPEIETMRKNLTGFYQIILKLFDQIDLKNDPKYADQAIRSLSNMAQTWFELKVPNQNDMNVAQTPCASIEVSA